MSRWYKATMRPSPKRAEVEEAELRVGQRRQHHAARHHPGQHAAPRAAAAAGEHAVGEPAEEHQHNALQQRAHDLRDRTSVIALVSPPAPFTVKRSERYGSRS